MTAPSHPAVEDLRRGLSSIRNFLGRLNPHDMAEGDTQQFESAWDQVVIFMPRALDALSATPVDPAQIRADAFEEAARISDSWNWNNQSSTFAHEAVYEIAEAIRALIPTQLKKEG